MFCEHCGAELRKGIRFCTKCGKEQPNPNADKPAEVIAQPSVPAPQTEETPDTATEGKVATAVNQVEREESPAAPPIAAEEDQKQAVEAQTDDAQTDDAPATPAAEEIPQAAPAVPLAEETPKAQQIDRASAKQRKGSASVSAGRKAVCVLLCAVIFLSALIASVAGAVRVSFTEEAVEGMLDDIELSEIDVLRDARTNRTVSVADYVYSLCDEKTLDKYSLTKDDIKKVIKELEWKDFATDALSDLSDYLIRGEELELEAEDIVGLFKDNEALLTEALNGFRFNYDKIEDAVEDNLIVMLEPKGIQKAIGIEPSFISAVFSLVTIFICIGLALAMAVLILLMTRFSVQATLGYVGMTGIVLGGLLLVGGAVGTVLFLMEGFLFVGAIFGKLTLNLLITGAVMLAVSVLLFVLSRILKAVGRKKA